MRTLPHNNATDPEYGNTNDIQLGDRVTGRCVTMGTSYTGTVVQIIPPQRYSGQCDNRYRIINTGKHYATGGPIEPIVECVAKAKPPIKEPGC